MLNIQNYNGSFCNFMLMREVSKLLRTILGCLMANSWDQPCSWAGSQASAGAYLENKGPVGPFLTHTPWRDLRLWAIEDYELWEVQNDNSVGPKIMVMGQEAWVKKGSTVLDLRIGYWWLGFCYHWKGWIYFSCYPFAPLQVGSTYLLELDRVGNTDL